MTLACVSVLSPERTFDLSGTRFDPSLREKGPNEDGHSLRDEIEHFFQRYKDLEPSKRTETRGWGNRDEAEKVLASARGRA